MRTPAARRFWPKVDKTAGPDGCWPWLGAKSSRSAGDSYGNFGWDDGRNVGAHRAAYMLAVGPIPDGLHIDHLCRNRICVNPAHLEPVTPSVNAHRGIGLAPTHAAKTACHAGHAFDATNTYLRPDGRGRECRACRREASARRNQKESA